MKRIIERSGAFGGVGDAINIRGGRWNLLQVNKPVYNSDGTTRYAASERNIILDTWGTQYEFEGLEFGVGTYADYVAACKMSIVDHSNVHIRNCNLPSATFVTRTVMYDIAPGGIYMFGNKYFDSGTETGNANVPDRFGCMNPDGQVSFTGASTTQTITLPQDEHALVFESPVGKVFYGVMLTPQGSTGSPPAGAFKARVTAKTKNSITVELDDAPGVGNTVTYFYQLRLNNA